MNTLYRFLILPLLIVAATANAAEDQLQVDHVMTQDPIIKPPGIVWVYAPRLKELWLQALRRPETELQRLAADTVSIAHVRGMAELESLTDDLLKTLEKAETEPNVRRAAAHALVALGAKQHAPALAKAAQQYGLLVQMVVEPALARWQSKDLLEVWRARVSEVNTPPQELSLAIDGLGALKDVESQPELLAIVKNAQSPNHDRLAAATALAAIGKGGMYEEARQLLRDKTNAGITARILAVRLLSADRDAKATEQLLELATDPEPSVAGAALNRVFDVEPSRVFPIAAQILKSSDVNVRRVGARALLLRADVAAIEALTPILGDPNPSLRRLVAKGMFDLAQKPELRGAVISATEQTLESDSWRGLEQASLLAAYLDHKPAAPRLIELLPHRRHEVAVSTAWALRRFKIPDTLAAILSHSQAQHARHLNNETPGHERVVIYAQQTQLFQLFGEMQFMEADKLLQQYVPKQMGLGESRMAACWALGKIHEGKGPPDLVAQFVSRLSDVNGMPPELENVRQMCAVGLGRMKAESSLPPLRRFTAEGTPVSIACWWSIHLLTGEEPPKIEAANFQVLGWFLQPVKE